MDSLPTDSADGYMELQEVIPHLQIPEATLHRWINELRLEKRLTRDGSRTVCHLPQETIRRLAEHKMTPRRRPALGRRITIAPPVDVEPERLAPLEEPAREDTPPAAPQTPSADSIAARALREALERAETLQAEMDALRASLMHRQEQPAAAPELPPLAPAPNLPRSVQSAPDPVYSTAIAVARAAGRVAYGTYWLAARVLLPRDISRFLLGLNKSDYIGWNDDGAGEIAVPNGSVPLMQRSMRARPSTLARRRRE